ncbi:MAG: DEAD/DEAH box helicase [Candidatus Omnitrophota bacterium]
MGIWNKRRASGQDTALKEGDRKKTKRRKKKFQGARLEINSLEGIEIGEEYQRILSAIETCIPFIFVTGKAGTGKTTLIDVIRAKSRKKMVVVAPTGVAAINAKGVTIHSFFRFPPVIIQKSNIKMLPDRTVISELELLVIDEVSMVRPDVVDGIDLFLQKNKGNRLPFGGVQVLFIGDLFQLSPVVRPKDREVLTELDYDNEYFFSAHSLRDEKIFAIELSKIYRQEDRDFINALNKIRCGEDLDAALDVINRNAFRADYVPKSDVMLTCTNSIADRENSAKLDGIKSEVYEFEGEFKGDFSLEDERLPSSLNLKLKLGSQVMFTKNDEMKRWVNGTIGIIRDIDQQKITVELVFNEGSPVYEISRVTWTEHKYEYDETEDKIVARVKSEYIQYPLMLAWAITIHKSQGKTLDRVYIDLGNRAFAPGQVYVALSRARRLSNLRLARPIRKADIICNDNIVHFYRAMKEIETQIKNIDN